MNPKVARTARRLMWALALLVALLSLRYLVLSPHVLMLFPLHVLCGALTLAIGLLQFNNQLRARRPALHRAVGYLYLAGVLVGGIAGFILAPDTRSLFSESLTEEARLGTFYGLRPESFGIRLHGPYVPAQFTSLVYSFATLALVWLFVTSVAFRHALRRDFARHREWMIRSYSLTFAAVTVRLAVALCLVIIREPVLAANLGLSSWALNLLVAEWIIRRSQPKPAALAAHA